MRLAPEDLHQRPNALARHYSRFRVGERLLLTGHSHQAWPDAGREGQLAAWDDAAEAVDDKWERAFAKADRVRRGFARLLNDAGGDDGDDGGDLALAPNTHELVVRFLSALDLRRRPRLVTTDGEFHSIRRQLARLAEEGIEVVAVAAADPSRLAETLAAAVDDRTAAVLVSAVLFQSARIVPGLDRVAAAAERHGAELLVDVYHALDAVPFDLRAAGLGGAWVVGGGYKYCQLGEGNCFLRTPPGCRARPVVTGWYAEFEALSEAAAGRVSYGPGGWRFAGATYDPTSHYRAAAVLDFFAEQGLDPPFLRAVSRHQVGLLAAELDALDLDPRRVRRDRSVDLAEVGGFLVLEAPRAGELCRALARRGVATDHRGTALRLGPAPYLDDDQLRAAVALLGESVAEIGG